MWYIKKCSKSHSEDANRLEVPTSGPNLVSDLNFIFSQNWAPKFGVLPTTLLTPELWSLLSYFNVMRWEPALEPPTQPSPILRKINFLIWDQIWPALGYVQATGVLRMRFWAGYWANCLSNHEVHVLCPNDAIDECRNRVYRALWSNSRRFM